MPSLTLSEEENKKIAEESNEQVISALPLQVKIKEEEKGFRMNKLIIYNTNRNKLGTGLHSSIFKITK